MNHKAVRIIACIFAGLAGGILILAGAIFIGSGLEGMDDLKVFSGTLHVISPAYDDVLGLTDMGPVIFRDAEMYQWTREDVEIRKKKSSHYYPYGVKAFEPYAVPSFKGYSSKEEAKKHTGKQKSYENPAFPEDFLNGDPEYNNGLSVISGDVEIGDSGVKLDGSILSLFDGRSFCMEDCTVPAFRDPEDAGEPYGLKHVGEGVYATREGDDYKIGDMVVTCRVVNPKMLDREYTAVGKLSKNKVLSLDGDRGALYEGIVSPKEINKDYRNDQFKEGFLFIFLGLAIAGTIFLISFFPFKKNR